jgi:FkbM family methyltransferase
LLRFFSGRLAPRIAYPVITGPLRGARFVLGSFAGEGGGASVYFGTIEPDQTKALVNTLGPGRVFFDIGANAGYYTVLAAKLVGSQGTVVALEPVVRNLAYLYKHISINIDNENVILLPMACCERFSLRPFSTGINYATGHITAQDDDEGKLTLVPTVTVDIIVEALDLIPDVMKIDVEGAEFKVLEGAGKTIREAKPDIFLSTHSRHVKNACLGYLRDLNYNFVPLDTKGSEPVDFLASCTVE